MGLTFTRALLGGLAGLILSTAVPAMAQSLSTGEARKLSSQSNTFDRMFQLPSASQSRQPAQAPQGGSPVQGESVNAMRTPIDYGPQTVLGEQLFLGNFAQQAFSGFNPDYRIAVGDSITLQMWGAYEFSQTMVVDAQGNLFIPQVGPVRVLGNANSKLNNVIGAAVKRVFQNNVNVYANLEASQPVKVFVTGFVRQPGLYNGLSSDSLLTYLDKAGGIDPERGSFLDIRLMRGGKVRQKVNLYDFLFDGRLERVQLHEGDTLLVGRRQSMVQFGGLVENPFMIEFAESDISLYKALNLANVLPEATHIRVTRNSGTVRNTEYFSIDEARNVVLRDGDAVEVTADKKQGTITVRVEGEHDSPQEYVLPFGTRLGVVLDQVTFNERSAADSISLERRSVKERQLAMLEQSLQSLETSVLTARSATNEEATLRTDEANLILQWVERAKSIEPRGQVVLGDMERARGLTLENGDIVRVPPIDALVMISGEVIIPNTVVFDVEKSLQDYINDAGGFTQNAEVSRILVMHQDGSFERVERGTFSDEISAKLQPGDQVMVLPRIDTKSMQIARDWTQILFQIALAAGVVAGL
jgi:protein involved in polysaccharide export with SLBB domain